MTTFCSGEENWPNLERKIEGDVVFFANAMSGMGRDEIVTVKKVFKMILKFLFFIFKIFSHEPVGWFSFCCCSCNGARPTPLY